MDAHSLTEFVMRVQNDFLDTPGLRLTSAEAQRRYHTDRVLCDAVLGALADSSVLTVARDGSYARFFPLAVPAPGQAA